MPTVGVARSPRDRAHDQEDLAAAPARSPSDSRPNGCGAGERPSCADLPQGAYEWDTSARRGVGHDRNRGGALPGVEGPGAYRIARAASRSCREGFRGGRLGWGVASGGSMSALRTRVTSCVTETSGSPAAWTIRRADAAQAIHRRNACPSLRELSRPRLREPSCCRWSAGFAPADNHGGTAGRGHRSGSSPGPRGRRAMGRIASDRRQHAGQQGEETGARASSGDHKANAAFKRSGCPALRMPRVWVCRDVRRAAEEVGGVRWLNNPLVNHSRPRNRRLRRRRPTQRLPRFQGLQRLQSLARRTRRILSPWSAPSHWGTTWKP